MQLLLCKKRNNASELDSIRPQRRVEGRDKTGLAAREPEHVGAVFSREAALMDRRGMQRRGSPAGKWRGAIVVLVACALASQGVGFVGIAAGEGVETEDVPGGGQQPEGRLTAGDGGEYDGAVINNAGSAAKDNDAPETEEDANKDFVAPEPSEAVQVNGVQDIEQEELKKAVNELPPSLLDELPPELWGVREVKHYKRAEKNIGKGDKALNAAANIATFGGGALASGGGGREAAILLFILALLSGIIAAPVAIGGAIRRSIGRRQKRKLKKRLGGKKKTMELRAERLPMLPGPG